MHPKQNIAVKAVRLAGDSLFRAAYHLEDCDFLAAVSHAEGLMMEVLQKAFGQHCFSSEKTYLEKKALSSDDQKIASDCEWLINPMDGLENYTRGFPYYCVSLALVQKEVVDLAVIYDPSHNNLYTAQRGGGAYFNNRRLRLTQNSTRPTRSVINKSKDKTLENSFIGIGPCFYDIHQPSSTNRILDNFKKAGAVLRSQMSISLELARVAAGQLDAFFDNNLTQWDKAAGGLLVKEAGGFVGNSEQSNEDLFYHPDYKDLIASQPKIFPKMLALVNESY